MSIALAGTYKVELNLTETDVRTLSNVVNALQYTHSKSLTTGTGANQANRVFHDSHNVANATAEYFDLVTCAWNGGAAARDTSGTAYNIGRVVMLHIENQGANTVNLYCDTANANAANAVLGLATGNASDPQMLIGAGGFRAWGDPSAAAMNVVGHGLIWFYHETGSNIAVRIALSGS